MYQQISHNHTRIYMYTHWIQMDQNGHKYTEPKTKKFPAQIYTVEQFANYWIELLCWNVCDPSSRTNNGKSWLLELPGERMSKRANKREFVRTHRHKVYGLFRSMHFRICENVPPESNTHSLWMCRRVCLCASATYVEHVVLEYHTLNSHK